MIMIDY